MVIVNKIKYIDSNPSLLHYIPLKARKYDFVDLCAQHYAVYGGPKFALYILSTAATMLNLSRKESSPCKVITYDLTYGKGSMTISSP